MGQSCLVRLEDRWFTGDPTPLARDNIYALPEHTAHYRFTDCKVKKAYTRLGISCHNAYTKSHC